MEPSRPSATPLKASAGTTVAGGGEPPYDENMEHRITALEARWDAVFPTLATKADLVELRTELRDGLHQNALATAEFRSEMQRSFGELRTEAQQTSGELRTDAQQSSGELRTEMQRSFSELRNEMQQSSGELRIEMQRSFSELRNEMQQSSGDLRTQMQKLSADNKSWMLATVLTITGTMLAAILGISQIYKAAPPPLPIIITVPGALPAFK